MSEQNLIRLDNISKIYSAEGNAAVGIHNIDVSFNKGEFVLISGESGAGKTTMLNVIGGMDSFEEGEFFFAGAPISAYTEKEVDRYREENISFVFQNYNIVECLSVYNNVYVSLIDQRDKDEIKKKINEVLRKTGLIRIAAKNAGKLSGGQKQRVAIARALAAGKSIILADEPTANLDEETAKEIVELFAEVSKNCLVIVSSHNREIFQNYITREIKMGNGRIIEDNQIKHDNAELSPYDVDEKVISATETVGKIDTAPRKFKKGINLGIILLRAKNKTMAMLFCILFFSVFFLFLLSSAFLMKIHQNVTNDGRILRGGEDRVMVLKRDGSAFSANELSDLRQNYGADRLIHCDILFDAGDERMWYQFMENPSQFALYDTNNWAAPFQVVEKYDIGEPDFGRYPSNENECMLYIPYALADYYGRSELKNKTEKMYGVEYQVVGLKYYKENDRQGQMLLTPEGYQTCAYMAYMGSKLYCEYQIDMNGENVVKKNDIQIVYSYDISPDVIALREGSLSTDKFNDSGCNIKIRVYNHNDDDKSGTVQKEYINYIVEKKKIEFNGESTRYHENSTIIINPASIVPEMARRTEENYRQCSLFFENADDAKKAISCLNYKGYLAIGGKATYQLSKDTVSYGVWSIVGGVAAEIAIILIIGLAIHFCTVKIMQSLRYDVNVMRAVGVNRKYVHIALYTFFAIPFIVSISIVEGISLVLYRIAFLNKYLLWLRPWVLVLLFMGILFVTWRAVEHNRKKYLDVSVINAFREGVQ